MFNYHHFRGNVGRAVQSYVLRPSIQDVDEALENFTQKGEMPKRVRSGLRTPPSSGNKRKRTKQHPKQRLRSARKQLWKVSTTAKPMSSGNTITGALKFKGGKVSKEGRKKKVRVSKEFRKKVNEAIKSRNGTGWLKEVIPQPTLIPKDNAQAVQPIYQRYAQTANQFAFTPTYIDYCASVLYNKKTATNPYTSTGSSIDDTGYFRRENLKIEVLEQYYIVKMRNNTARTMDVKIFDVSPKYTQEIGVNSSATYGPVDHWAQALLEGQRDGAAGTVRQQSNENPTNVIVETLGAHPMDSAYFRGQYTCDTTYVKLEPGKEYYHKVKGPNRKLYDYNKFFKNGIYSNVKPFCKSTFVALNLELTATTLNTGANRTTDIVTGQGYGLIMETENFVKLRLPDKAGFQVPNNALAAGEIQTLTQVGNAFAINNWYDAQSGGVVLINDENPQDVTMTGK